MLSKFREFMVNLCACRTRFPAVDCSRPDHDFSFSGSNIKWKQLHVKPRPNLLFVVVLFTEKKISCPCIESKLPFNGPLVFNIRTWPTFRLQKVMAKFAGLMSLLTLAHVVLLMQPINCTVHMGISRNAKLFAWKWCRLHCCICFGIHVQWMQTQKCHVMFWHFNTAHDMNNYR